MDTGDSDRGRAEDQGKGRQVVASICFSYSGLEDVVRALDLGSWGWMAVAAGERGWLEHEI